MQNLIVLASLVSELARGGGGVKMALSSVLNVTKNISAL